MPETPSLADAVRARFAQALARRAQAHTGAARRVLDERLAALAATPHDSPLKPPLESRQDSRQDLPLRSPLPSPHHAPPAGPQAPHAGALAQLVAYAARQKTVPVLAAVDTPREGVSTKGVDSDTRTVQFFKRTWSRLSADRRLAQSRATLPENAGPLNSHHLVHRSLTLMRELSPEYLECFVAYVDALQWLEQANEATAQEPRAAGPKRSMPARR